MKNVMKIDTDPGLPAVAFDSLDSFTKGYITAAFWTSDDDAPSGDYQASGRVEELFPTLAAETVQRMKNDCAAFQAANAGLLESCGTPERNGVDLWLTRNRHGAGYWDRDYEETVSKKITLAAHALGEVDLYKGDDGKLYL